MANAYTLAQALQLAGKNLDQAGARQRGQHIGLASSTGPGLVPFRYSTTVHGGYAGAEMGQVRKGQIVLFGGPLVTEPTAGSRSRRTRATARPPASGVSVP